MTEHRGAGSLVGRDSELRQLDAALGRAALGEGRVALIAGEAGIGRTRLCIEVGRVHAGRGGQVLLGRTFPEDASLPLAPIVDTLRAARRGGRPLWEAAGRVHVLQAVLPELAPEGRSGDHAALFEALLDAVDEAASGRPTLWVLDDVHWADNSTWEFVRYATRRVDDMRLVLAVTYREEEIGHPHPWWAGLARLRRDPCVLDLRLRRLDAADSARLARVLAPELPEAALQAIVERSAGTPLLIEELVKAAGRAAELPSVPDIVLATLRERAARVGPAARELLHVAAVAGPEMDAALLASLRPEPPVDELVAAGILERAGERVRFRHPLLREAAHHEVPPVRRRDLRRAIARAQLELASGALSPREVEVAGLVAEGLTNPAIARRLNLSRPTVASHVAHILGKLDFSSRAQIAAWVAGLRDPGAERAGPEPAGGASPSLRVLWGA
jgi:predicted ATPase